MSLVKRNGFGFEYRTVQRQRGALGKAFKARRAGGLVCTTKKEYMNNLILFMSVGDAVALNCSLAEGLALCYTLLILIIYTPE